MKKITLFFAALLISMTAFCANTLYLKPNSNWVQGSAWFAVNTWGGTASQSWLKMTDDDGDGVYEATFNGTTPNIIFCRMNPEKTALGWDSKWDQTVDLQFQEGKNCFTVKDGDWNKASGTWSTYTPVVHTYTLAGDNASLFGTEWDPGNTRNDLVDNGDGTWSKTYDDVVFAASTTIKFKVCLDHAWDQSWGENGADASYTISEAGTYDVTFTFTLSSKKTVVTATKQQTIDPGEDPTPEPEPDPEPDPEPTTYTVYFDNTNTKWEAVYAYCWEPQNATWPGEAMTPIEGHDGFFSYTTTTAYDNIVFNNGNGDQTIDLTFPKDVNNLFKITGESGGKKTGTWSAYVAPDPNKPVVRFTNLGATAPIYATIKPEAAVENIENPTFVYTVSYEGGEAVALDENGYSLNDYGVYEFTVVATGDNDVTATATAAVEVELVAVMGSAELCHGYYWERAKENAMYPVDGVYSITYKDVPAGTYEFKVGFGRGAMLGIESIDSENSTSGFTGDDNISFTLSETTDIVISYSTLTGKVILEGVGLEQFGEFVATSYTLCGSVAIFGEEFNTTLTANDMVETSTGVWTKTYSNVPLEAEVVYYYKVAANYDWNVGQYPARGDKSFVVEEAGNYNLTFTYEPNKAEGEKLGCNVEKVEIKETYHVFFDNADTQWENVYAYCWSGSGEEVIKNAEWPGVAMDNFDVTWFEYSTEVVYDSVIFNAGIGKPQTLNFVFANNTSYSFPFVSLLGTVNGSNEIGWDPDNKEFRMTFNPENPAIWTKELELPAGDYEFKFYYGDWVNTLKDNPGNSTPGYKYTGVDQNVSFSLVETTTVTFTYNSAESSFTINANIKKFGEFVATSYTLCGSEEIFGVADQNLAPAATENDMELVDGVWTKTYKYIPLTVKVVEEKIIPYKYKVAANHAWNEGQYPAGTAYEFFNIEQDGVYNLTFTYNPEAEEFQLTCDVELVNPAAPEFSVLEGQFEEEFALEIMPAVDENRDIYVLYTTDGTDPNPAVIEGEECTTLLYKDGVMISETTTVKAIIVIYDEDTFFLKDIKGNYVVSAITSATYTKKDITVALENAEIANIFIQNGMIVVDGEYAIYTITGQNVTDMNGRLATGVYVVRTANATTKVVIK